MYLIKSSFGNKTHTYKPVSDEQKWCHWSHRSYRMMIWKLYRFQTSKMGKAIGWWGFSRFETISTKPCSEVRLMFLTVDVPYDPTKMGCSSDFYRNQLVSKMWLGIKLMSSKFHADFHHFPCPRVDQSCRLGIGFANDGLLWSEWLSGVGL